MPFHLRNQITRQARLSVFWQTINWEIWSYRASSIAKPTNAPNPIMPLVVDLLFQHFHRASGHAGENPKILTGKVTILTEKVIKFPQKTGLFNRKLGHVIKKSVAFYLNQLILAPSGP